MSKYGDVNETEATEWFQNWVCFICEMATNSVCIHTLVFVFQRVVKNYRYLCKISVDGSIIEFNYFED